MTWQPIDTAPETTPESRFLVAGTLDEEAEVSVHEVGYVWEDSGRWRFSINNSCCYDGDYGVATHWRPLPDPPTE